MNMPDYDYECKKCGHQWRITASLAEKEKGLDTSCPKCKSTDTYQLFNKLCFGEAEDFRDEEPMPDMPPGGGGMGGMPPGMGGMPMGIPPGMCGPGGMCGM